MSGKVRLGIGLGILIIGLAVGYPKIALYLSSRKTTVNTSTVAFYIKHKQGIDELAEALKQAGVLDNVSDFKAVAAYKGLDKENIALGKYNIETGTQLRTLLNGFRLNDAGNGNGEVEVQVTFNNCRDLRDLAGKVSDVLMLDSAKLVAFLNDDQTLTTYGFNAAQMPAMFIPNTYNMYYDTDEKAFVKRMADEFKSFWTDERKSKIKAIGLKGPSEVVTLASVVYSEQNKVASEWPIIAGLYLNRIEQGIKLQSDPTFKFCWGDQLNGVQRLLNVHRDIDCPYNTYKVNGLPPGPICIPPSQVIEAVLNRDKNDYIFMMAKPDYSGLHDFTKEYKDHQRLATIYQSWLAKELAKG